MPRKLIKSLRAGVTRKRLTRVRKKIVKSRHTKANVKKIKSLEAKERKISDKYSRIRNPKGHGQRRKKRG